MDMRLDAIMDTQVLSKGFQDGIDQQALPAPIIASPTAKEFLLAQSLNGEKPLYFVLHPAIYDHLAETGNIRGFEHYGNHKWAKFGSRRTDEIIFDLGKDYPSYREYGDQALALLINDKKEDIFKLSISHLPKYRQKYLFDRWRYIVGNELFCLPLNDDTVKVGLTMFSQFLEKHSPKASVANTVLDMLIFGFRRSKRTQAPHPRQTLGVVCI